MKFQAKRLKLQLRLKNFLTTNSNAYEIRLSLPFDFVNNPSGELPNDNKFERPNWAKYPRSHNLFSYNITKFILSIFIFFLKTYKNIYRIKNIIDKII